MKTLLVLFQHLWLWVVDKCRSPCSSGYVAETAWHPIGNAVDPVKGPSFPNDPGQTNATGKRSSAKAATFSDCDLKESLSINQDQSE